MDDPDKVKPNWWKLISSVKRRSRILVLVSSLTIAMAFAAVYFASKGGSEKYVFVGVAIFAILVFLAVTILTITAISQDIHLDKKHRRLKGSRP